jgi:hypothetical protein
MIGLTQSYTVFEAYLFATHLMDGVFRVLHLGSVLLIILVFCVVILYVFMFGVPCCGVRYDFRIKRC